MMATMDVLSGNSSNSSASTGSVFYFAYGSNLDPQQMRERCPRATTKFIAEARGWKLCFPRSSERRGGGVASIEPGLSSVWGVVYELSREDWKRLNRREGYDPSREPSHNSYNWQEISVHDYRGSEHRVGTYVATPALSNPPAQAYLDLIVRGAKAHGLPEPYMTALKRIPARNGSSVDEKKPLLLVPAGKIRCYVHSDVLREDTPEEHVRQRVARSLVEEYGYPKSDLHLELPIKIGSGSRKKVDIAVFPAGAEHKQEKVFIIVEAKREDVRPSDRKDGVDQLKSYMAACINARWGLWVGSEMAALEKEQDARRAAENPFLEATDIPLRGEQEPKRLIFGELVPATHGLSGVFKRCHNYLHSNGNMGKEKAFFELLKLIFCKVYDEQETSGTMEFSINQEERRSDLGQRKLKARIAKLFDAVKENYPYIFPGRSEQMELDSRSLAYIVSELQKFNFQETASDIKGEAYEEIVSVTSRRDHGAFFTPRNVCEMAVRMVFCTYTPEKRLRLRIIDPACGTGGFLRAALLQLKEVISTQVSAKWKGDRDRSTADILTRLRKLCDSNIFGIDKLAELVRAAQMNLAMHGDGSTNVFHANSLLPAGEWPEDVRERIRLSGFDVLITNPPFGSRLPVDDPYILDQFQLAKVEAVSPRTAMPPEQLFVERCLSFLKPGGRMAIVLPDSILSNPGLAFIRRWVLKQAYVIASIDLPREMFARSDTHTMTSILILQKFTAEERRNVEEHGPPDYDIFMAIADHVGWDLRGSPVYVRTPEGDELLQKRTQTITVRNAKGDLVETVEETEEPIINDQLPSISELFNNWLKASPKRWMVE
jgi:type I restriction enzyme M protein